MEIIYYYLFNIKTLELKIIECDLEILPYNNNTVYRLTSKDKRNYKIKNSINDLDTLYVQRNGIFLSGGSRDNTRIEEFKMKCIDLINDYKRRCEDNIKSLSETINKCNNSLNVLKQ